MKNKKDPEFIVEDAAKVIYENIGIALKSKLTLDKIGDILDIEVDFYKLKGLISDEKPKDDSKGEAPFIDTDELARYLADNCVKKGIDLTQEEASEILKAEDIYMKQIGLFD
jgi:hypothetical protein